MVQKSINPLQKASITGITFKQNIIERPAAGRPENIAIIAQYQTGKTIVDYVPDQVSSAGNVGATTAYMTAGRDLGDVVLLDIVEGMPQGKALDMGQAAGVRPFASSIIGTTNWKQTADSDIVLITSGLPRKPGMSRDDLLAKNTAIVKSV